MDFGRLKNIESVDFSLPPLLPKKLGPPKHLQIRLGTPSWVTADFAKRMYPRGTKSYRQLELYSQSFRTVELDSTFYAVPKVETIEAWREHAGPKFRFCPKFPQLITHEKFLIDAKEDAQFFLTRMKTLGDKLGPAILQLPPDFIYAHGQRLKDFLLALPQPHEVAVEFRHESWFEHGQVKERVVEFLNAQKVALVITDVAGRRDVSHASISTRTALVRFQGYELHPSDFARMDAWAERLLAWQRQGLEEVYFFLHQHEQVRSIDMGIYFRKILTEAGFRDLPPVHPAGLEAEQPTLL